VRSVLVTLLASSLAFPLAARAQSHNDPLPVGRPLGAYAGRRVLLLPTQYLRPDTIGFSAQIADGQDYLANLDAELAFALAGRGLKDTWLYPAQLEAASKRNKGYAPSPYGLAAQWLRPPGPRKMPDQLPDPLATQLRQLVAIEEDAQFVLMPLEIRFERTPTGMGVAQLRMVMFDARRSIIVWEADVPSAPASAMTPALAESVAEHFADLVAAP